ncbi:hypothetical protein D3C73_1153860 [compost metagenome]
MTAVPFSRTDIDLVPEADEAEADVVVVVVLLFAVVVVAVVVVLPLVATTSGSGVTSRPSCSCRLASLFRAKVISEPAAMVPIPCPPPAILPAGGVAPVLPAAVVPVVPVVVPAGVPVVEPACPAVSAESGRAGGVPSVPSGGVMLAPPPIIPPLAPVSAVYATLLSN